MFRLIGKSRRPEPLRASPRRDRGSAGSANCRKAAALLLFVAIGGCMAPQQQRNPFTGFFKGYDTCRQQYAEMDARVEAAGVRDAGYWRVPGYPYLRTDRTLATLGSQVHGLDDTSEWLRRMRELDQESRAYEAANLGLEELEAIQSRDRFLNCGRVLASIELLDDPERFKQLIATVYPRDDYSTWNRFIGFYPLRVPHMLDRLDQQRLGALRRIERARADDAVPRDLWKVRQQADSAHLALLPKPDVVNDIGYPGLFVSQWRALAERHAPAFWIEGARVDEGPSTPVLTPEGAAADPDQATLSYRIGYTLFQGRPVVQLTYVLWFKGAEPGDPVALDGLIWRVTLDASFATLVYESLHVSGSDHRWYSVQPMSPRQVNGSEPAFIVPGRAPDRQVVLHLRSGSHEIVQVRSEAQAAASRIREYELKPYEDLYTLPAPGGGTRSLFGPDGLMAGSRGVDPIGGRYSGIAQPGAIRQLGHHAIAHVGRRHFDDPDLLDQTFEPATQ